MKSIPLYLMFAGLVTGISALAANQPSAAPAKEVAVTQAATNAVPDQPPPLPAAAPQLPPVAQPPAPATNDASAAVTLENGAPGLRLNFRGAPLNLVLDFLSDAAGFVINKETEVRGTVDVWSKDPVSKDEAVELLNSVLRKNGYAVTRSGRILTIVSLDTAKTSDLEVISGNDFNAVQKSDEVVTQIIPVRYANASQLMNNLQVLLPTSATLSANESANTLILVATKTDIRRMLKIVNALDTSIASVSSIKVFPLRYADAKQLATIVQQLFAPQTSNQGPGGMSSRAQLFSMFRGGGGFPGGGAPGGASGGSGGNAAGSKVVAASDDYSNSLIVLASAELLATVSDMVQQIDQPTTDTTEVRVFRLVNADPQETADQLATLFPDDTSSSGSGQSSMPFFFRGGFGRGGSTPAAGTSDRAKKMGRVLAVPDPRTSALIVTASKTIMPQIADMIAELDSDKGKKEVVGYYELQNADPQDVQQNLTDLFNRNNVRMQNNNNRNSMLGQNNPLTQRQTQNQQATTGANSSFGGSSSRGSSSMGF